MKKRKKETMYLCVSSRSWEPVDLPAQTFPKVESSLTPFSELLDISNNSNSNQGVTTSHYSKKFTSNIFDTRRNVLHKTWEQHCSSSSRNNSQFSNAVNCRNSTFKVTDDLNLSDRGIHHDSQMLYDAATSTSSASNSQTQSSSTSERSISIMDPRFWICLICSTSYTSEEELSGHLQTHTSCTIKDHCLQSIENIQENHESMVGSSPEICFTAVLGRAIFPISDASMSKANDTQNLSYDILESTLSLPSNSVPVINNTTVSADNLRFSLFESLVSSGEFQPAQSEKNMQTPDRETIYGSALVSTCKLCGKVLSTKWSLRRHMEKIHDKHERDVKIQTNKKKETSTLRPILPKLHNYHRIMADNSPETKKGSAVPGSVVPLAVDSSSSEINDTEKISYDSTISVFPFASSVCGNILSGEHSLQRHMEKIHYEPATNVNNSSKEVVIQKEINSTMRSIAPNTHNDHEISADNSSETKEGSAVPGSVVPPMVDSSLYEINDTEKISSDSTISVFPFACSVCGKILSGEHSLQRHMEKIHNEPATNVENSSREVVIQREIDSTMRFILPNTHKDHEITGGNSPETNNVSALLGRVDPPMVDSSLSGIDNTRRVPSDSIISVFPILDSSLPDSTMNKSVDNNKSSSLSLHGFQHFKSVNNELESVWKHENFLFGKWSLQRHMEKIHNEPATSAENSSIEIDVQRDINSTMRSILPKTHSNHEINADNKGPSSLSLGKFQHWYCANNKLRSNKKTIIERSTHFSTCSVCGKILSGKWSLQRHMEKTHNKPATNVENSLKEIDTRRETTEIHPSKTDS